MTNPSDWIRPEIRALTAYHVPESGDVIKLDAMENPYAWPEAMRREWSERLRDVALNRYPDAGCRRLKAALREYLALPVEQGLVLGNGSDELIQLIALALAGPDRVVLAPEPTFVMYRMIATFAGMRYVGVPLAGGFALDVEAMRAAIARERPAVVFLAWPNNPTGNLWDRGAMLAVIREAPGLVVVDEAYYPFAGESFVAELGRHENLLVMRTVSKLGLAGLRLGMLAGPRAWLEEIDKLRLPYNINSLTQVSAEFALRRLAVLDEQAARIREERGRLAAALDALDGVRVFPSRANFLLFRCPPGSAGRVFAGLRRRGVLIKSLDGGGPALADCLRVTVGTPEENDIFLDALRAAL